MRKAIPLISILFGSTLFLSFPDIKMAMENAPTDYKLSGKDITWAKKVLSLYRDGYYFQPYLRSNDYKSRHDYVWELMEHAMILFLIFMNVIKSSDLEYHLWKWFFAIMFVNMVDAMFLTHSNAYFYVQEFPITYNVIAIPLFILICLVLTYQHGNSHRSL